MKGVKGYGFFIVLLVVIGIAYLCNNYIMDYDRDSYSVSQFKQDLQDKKIKKVTIEQNAEVPTGQLVIQYEKGTKQLYVSDVNEMVSYLDDQNFTREEKEKIFSLGERLGYLGMDMQLRQLQLLEEDLENEIQELNKDLKEKKKLYQSLGILLGILLAVLVA